MDYEEEIKIEKQIQKDVRDIKRSVRLECSPQQTKVVLVAISVDDCLNKMLFIPTGTGTPITQEVYDSVRDGFVLGGADFCVVGTVPVSYRLIFDESGWETSVPIPMPVIRRYLDEEQKTKLDVWKSRFPKDGYYFQTVQILEFNYG